MKLFKCIILSTLIWTHGFIAGDDFKSGALEYSNNYYKEQLQQANERVIDMFFRCEKPQNKTLFGEKLLIFWDKN